MKDFTVIELDTYLKDNQPLLLDVREQWEWDKCHLFRFDFKRVGINSFKVSTNSFKVGLSSFKVNTNSFKVSTNFSA